MKRLAEPPRNKTRRKKSKVEMQIRIFTMPLAAAEKQMEEMNHFLRANKIIDIRKELATVDGNTCWTFCVTYMQGSTIQTTNAAETKTGKVDYKDLLNEDAFQRFCTMRKVRKAIADADAVPAFAVFTDAELAELAKMDKVDVNTMLQVSGIGKKKVEKYGEKFCSEMMRMADETAGQLNRDNS